jgi:hypothetical protein
MFSKALIPCHNQRELYENHAFHLQVNVLVRKILIVALCHLYSFKERLSEK